MYPIVLLDDDDDDGDDDRCGENDELDRDETRFGDSWEETEEMDNGPAGESMFITGGVAHPELISWLDCALSGSSSSSESDNVKSITSILGFLLGDDDDDGDEGDESENRKAKILKC